MHPTYSVFGVMCQKMTFALYMDMLRRLNDCVKGQVSTTDCQVSSCVQSLMGILDELESWISRFPPKDLDQQRFGNKAFRDWHAKVVQESESLLRRILIDSNKDAVVELNSYFLDSFGNPTRIDYGSGHEASFLMFVCCLYQLKICQDSDSIAIVLRLFDRYLRLVRCLQRTYRMEPAGSRGVHALDDFQFVPFIWGSAQLIGQGDWTPESLVDQELVTKNQGHNLFFDAIQYINESKTGPFAEHSNQLWNISAVPSWTKVNSGLFKMYEAEVLKKYPVVQHFLFGSLLPFGARQLSSVS